MADRDSRPDMSGVSPKWIDGIPLDPNDPDWSAYDSIIIETVRIYNTFLQGVAGYSPLDPNLVKAMCWTETGANSPAWNSRPAQIGNSGDPGLQELLSQKPKCRLILPPIFYADGAQAITTANARTIPLFNIRAGVGYLLYQNCSAGTFSVSDPKAPLLQDPLGKGGSFSRFATQHQTTMDELKADNQPIPTRKLKPTTLVNYRPASMQTRITGWKLIDAYRVAETYNTKTVDEYTKKLTYCLWIFSGAGQKK